MDKGEFYHRLLLFIYHSKLYIFSDRSYSLTHELGAELKEMIFSHKQVDRYDNNRTKRYNGL